MGIFIFFEIDNYFPYIIFWVMGTKIKVKLQVPSQAQYFYLFFKKIFVERMKKE